MSLVLIVACVPLLANELSFSFSTGYMNGELHELVYRTPPRLLSELKWKIGDVLYTQAQLNGKIDNTFWFSLAVGVPVLLTPGADREQMVDRDWLFYEIGLESDDPSNISSHRVEQRPSLQWSGAIGLDLLPKSDMDLILGAGLSFIFWSWSDLSYEYDYRVSNSVSIDEKGSHEGDAISYQTSIWFLELLLRWRSPQWGPCRLTAQLAYSPYTIWLGYDSHLLKNTLYRDFGDFGQSLRLMVESEWLVARDAGVLVGAELQGLFENQGYGDSFSLEKGENISEAISREPVAINTEVGLSYFSYRVYAGFRLFFRL